MKLKFDENSFPLETCKNCGSTHVRVDSEFGFFKCEVCGTVWAYDAHDPDYEEMIEEVKFHNDKYPKFLYPDTPEEPN